MKNKKLIQKKKKYRKSLRQWRDSKKCAECGTTENLTNHHLIPKYVGGKDIKSNLIILCRKCHNKVHETQKGSV